jgi:1-acyl-sn-glycerol-3-phosphate acyltransferase
VQYQLSRIVAGPFLHTIWRPKVIGAHYVPASGGAILAANHLSVVDSIFLPLMLDRPVTFSAKAEYFTASGPAARLWAGYLKATNQLQIDREGPRAAQDTLEAALALLQAGNLFAIYPEGTRSPDGRLYRGRTGMARMALEAGCPVLPVAMIGTDKAQPSGKRVPKIMRIGVRIGKPLDFSRYEGMEDDRFVLRSVTDEVMYELMLLSRQEYVDMYATSMKNRLLAAARAKAKELQQEAVDKIEKIDKGIKGEVATLEPDDQSGAPGSAPDTEGLPPTSPGDERAAS